MIGDTDQLFQGGKLQKKKKGKMLNSSSWQHQKTKISDELLGSNIGGGELREGSFPPSHRSFNNCTFLRGTLYLLFVNYFSIFPPFSIRVLVLCPSIFRVLYILGILSICGICCKDFLRVFQLSLTLLVIFCHLNAFKKFYVVKFIFFKLLLDSESWLGGCYPCRG